jgi:hypothetical protein
MKLKTLLVSLGLGAGLMYFFDPQYGYRRRVLVQDRVNRWINGLDDSLEMAKKDLRNRARGVLSELTAKLSDQAPRIGFWRSECIPAWAIWLATRVGSISAQTAAAST